MITMESTGRLTHQRRRTRLLAVVGSALAAVAVWAVAEFGLGINVREPAGDVGAANVVFASVVASLAGWALLALLERVTARAARWWPAIATTRRTAVPRRTADHAPVSRRQAASCSRCCTWLSQRP